jgi:hypothetical protein
MGPGLLECVYYLTLTIIKIKTENRCNPYSRIAPDSGISVCHNKEHIELRQLLINAFQIILTSYLYFPFFLKALISNIP